MKTIVKTTAKTTLAVIVFGSMFAAVVPAKAAAFPVTSDTDGITIIGQQGAGYDLDKIATMTVDHDSAITTLQNGKADKMEVANMQGEINTINSNANQETANRVTADQQLQGEITQNKDAQDQVNHAFLNQNIQQDGRLSALENAPKPKDGVDGAKGDKGDTGATGANGKDGKDGANGVTTTITQVDTATQAKVAANTAAISSTSNQAAGVAQDLQDAKKVFSQQQANTNAQFKSLRDEVDSNKKEARSGAASAIAIASMPQVEAGQNVMFSAGVGSFKDEQAVSVGASFHAGAATVKTGVSTSTNNDFALGAGVGFGF
ncbi:YadA C-terminal domain-containing protein [Enterobacter ludwigii]|uniref:YadA C-terminal domain-containing protein n=1 Tax=unclassified Enterobacter TaxID=2608935 RepID=UPI001ABECD45|nr:YadA-like family protein [Enterobacter ludwigii]UOY69346.1 YadA C-terminal domain-containing protein [Enterobacter ludwigii]